MITKPIKDKTCKICKVKFTPTRPLQSVCSPNCAYTHAKAVRVKTERKETREAKVRLKSKSEWLKEAQTVFNQFIRLRDKDLPCISCGTTANVQYAAGHYLTTGAHPELRFDELNVHKQCNSYCNNHLSGNIVQYRMNLINKIGLDAVNYLEGKHEPKRYTIEDIKTLKAIYKEKVKTLTTNII